MTAPVPPPPGAGPPPPRGIGIVVWASMVAVLLLFLAMALTVERPLDDPNASRRLLVWMAVVSSAAGIALSRIIPPRIHSRHTGGRPGTNAFVRSVVGWGLLEAVAIYPAVAHLLAHDHRLLAIFAVDVLALVSLYPSRNAWAHLAAAERAGRTGRVVR